MNPIGSLSLIPINPVPQITPKIPSTTTNSCLETELIDEWMVDFDIHQKCHFEEVLNQTKEEYLEPNEEYFEAIKPHLDLAEKEIIVSTGTRSFFTLLFGDFKGMVIRDVNPLTKAYNDFQILLFKLYDIEEYNKMSAPIDCNWELLKLSTRQKAGIIIKQTEFSQRMTMISEKIEKSYLSDMEKRYYKKNLESLGAVYLSQKHEWRHKNSFSACHFHKNEFQFIKIQELARKGMIVSTMGCINKLGPFSKYKISVVDTSNIWNYTPIDLQGLSRTCTRIIATSFREISGRTLTMFYSCNHRPFSEIEAREFNDLFFNILVPCCNGDSVKANKIVKCLEVGKASDIFNITSPNIYSSRRLSLLRNHIEKNVIKISDFEPVDIIQNIKKLNTLSPVHIQKLCESPKTARFLENIVESSSILNPSIYLSFSNMKGWNEAFEKSFLNNPLGLIRFLGDIQQAALLTEFIEKFGLQEVNALIKECCNKEPLFKTRWECAFNTFVEDGISRFDLCNIDDD